MDDPSIPSIPSMNDAVEAEVYSDTAEATALSKPRRKPRSDAGKPRSKSKASPTKASGVTPGTLFYTITSPDGVLLGTYALKSTQLKPAIREISSYASVAEDHAGTTCHVFRSMDEFKLDVATVRKVCINRRGK